MDAPDLPHAVAGWRTWAVGTGPGGTRLLAPVTRALWPPGEVRTAWCRYGRHDAPAVSCRCGLYAVADLTRLTRQVTRGSVVGVTALWGRVVEAEHGWRGEHGYPVVLFAEPALSERTRARVAARYAVAVHRLPAPLETLVRSGRETVSALAATVRDETARAPGAHAPHRDRAVAELLDHLHRPVSRSA